MLCIIFLYYTLLVHHLIEIITDIAWHLIGPQSQERASGSKGWAERPPGVFLYRKSFTLMCALCVCCKCVCAACVYACVCVCDRTIESWETQIVARLSGYAACPCVWITCFSYMPHCCWGRGDRVRRKGVGVCVACVKLHLSDFLACSTQTQNYICRWEMPHNQVTTTECRVDRHGRLKVPRRRGRKGSWGSLRGARQTKLTIDRCNRSILAQWYVELPSPPLSLPVFGRKLHFVKAFLRLLLTKQRNAWEMARNKPWQAVNMQIVSRLRRSSTWVYKHQEQIQVQVRRLALSLGTLSF